MGQRFFDDKPRLLLGAGVAVGGVAQAGADPVQPWLAILVLAACLLPIVMAVFGAVVMRVLGWLTRPPSTEEEVVYPERTLPPGVHLPDPTIRPALLAFGLMFLVLAIPLGQSVQSQPGDLLRVVMTVATWTALGLGGLLFVIGLLGWIMLEVKEFRLRRR
jgi:hypothetical protein